MPEAPGPLPRGLDRDALVRETARGLRAVPDGASVVVAASGGPDSTALSFLVSEARPDLELTLAHIDHGTPDTGARAAVEGHGRAIGVAVTTVDVEVRETGEGWEAAARDARYRALRRIAKEAESSHVLVGHTADDQAETVLLRAARGTGVDGLRAMAASRPDTEGLSVLRPLLRLRRSDLRVFVELEGLTTVADPMNFDRRFARVRMREEVIPALERIASDPVGALARLADLAGEDAAVLSTIAARHVDAAMRRYGPVVAIPVDELTALEIGLRRRVVRHLIAEVRPETRPVDAAHIEAVLALGAGAALDLPGATVTLGGGWLAVAPSGLEAPEAVMVSVPGVTPWPAAGVEIVVDRHAPLAPGPVPLPLPVVRSADVDSVDVAAIPPGGDPSLGTVSLPEHVLGEGTVVRSRLPGDRIRLTAGGRKLQDLLVDRGVPRAARDLVPIVANGDHVLWVPGVAADVEVASSPAHEDSLHLAVRVRL